jgi:YVTN family beta-propeller protein
MDTDELIGIIDLDGISIAMNREFIWTPTGLCAVTLSPDKSMMMTVAGDSNLMYAYDMNTSKWTTELLNIQGFFPTDAITSIDGKYLYTVNQHSDNITMIDISKRQVVGLISLIANSDGDLAPLGNRDGSVNIGDALVALRFALGLETPSQEDVGHGDVAPLDTQNKPNPDGVINVGDALVILRKALGIVFF